MPNKIQSLDIEELPGPGAHDMNYRTMGTEGRKWNMQARCMNPVDDLVLKLKGNTPGPGQYG